jgi:hypothetical protein
MPAGIRVTVEFPAPPVCPIADLSARADTVVSDVSTSVATDDGSVTEFLVDADAVPEDYDADLVFTYADRNLYRVRHDDADCPCACLGEFDTPVDPVLRPERGATAGVPRPGVRGTPGDSGRTPGALPRG